MIAELQHTALLAHVTEVSSLLTISKDILTDRSILASAFPNLNPVRPRSSLSCSLTHSLSFQAQIRAVLASYVPEGPGDAVAPAVLAFFEREQPSAERPLLVGPEAAERFLAQLPALLAAPVN